MKTLLLSALTAATLPVAAPMAEAHPGYHYRGGCGYTAISDGSNSSSTQWDGEIHVAAVATDAATGTPAAAPITVECELRINGAAPGTIVFSASGIGGVANAGSFSFHAHPDDVVTMCDVVDVGGNLHKSCNSSEETDVAHVDAYAILADFTFDCFGCSEGTGSFAGDLIGSPSGAVFGTFTHNSVPASTCTAVVTGSGTVSGAVSGAFSVTYVAPATLIITLTASGTVWVGATAGADIDCLGQRVTAFAGAGVGVSI